MQQLILTKGLPASGKSTWAKAWVLEAPKDRIRVCRDDIRRMLGPYWVPEREHLVSIIEKQCIFDALQNKYSVVIDATNFRPPVDGKYLTEIYNCEYILKDFTDVPLELCIERDKLRPGDQRVGEEVIMNFYNKYLNK